MAASYTVNLNMNSGVAFAQKFYLTNPDKSPLNISGYRLFAKMAKHSAAMVATKSTVDKPAYAYFTINANVSNGQKGEYTLAMSAHKTARLAEGKYVYSVVAQDKNGVKSEVADGLVFVERAFASPESETVFDGGGALIEENNSIIIDGGSSGSY